MDNSDVKPYFPEICHRELRGFMKDTGKAKSPSLFVSSLAKGLNVLEAFEAGHRELGIAEIVELTGLERSAASRLVQTLFKVGYLRQERRNRKYTLSPRVLSIAYSYLRANPIVEVAMPRLVGLGDVTDTSVSLCMLTGVEIIYAVRLERHEFYYPTGLIGERQPAYCTSGGRAILSRLPEETANDILQRSNRQKITPSTRTELQELLTELRTARELSYCVQASEFILNEINLAAPVLNATQTPVAAVVVSRLYREEEKNQIVKDLAPPLLQTVKELSGALGSRF